MLQSMRGNALRYVVWAIVAVTFIVVFLLLDTSGLLGGSQVTPGTAVGTVNGRDITYQAWQAYTRNLLQQEQQRLGRSLTLDEQRRLQDDAFERLVSDILLAQEYRRRGITVSDEEIVQYASVYPPPFVQQDPEMYTDGQFDFDKYRRLLASPIARQTGLNYQIEQFYRTEVPRQKLFDQIASAVYLNDARLWRMWQDERDSAAVSFIALRPERIPDTAVSVSDDEVRAFYNQRRDQFDRPGRAVVSLLAIPREVSAADSAAARERILELRQEIAAGTSFADVARRESIDSASAQRGGDLGRGVRGRFVPEFEQAAYALRVGELSQPVLTQFGYHLIRVDDRRGDTLSLRHILIRPVMGDAAATTVDRRADSLAVIASSAEDPARFDSAARVLRLQPMRALVFEGEPLVMGSQQVPSVSAWAFSGARVGETSELFDSEEGYFLARLDTLVQGGVAPLADVREQIRAELVRRKKLDALMPLADSIAREAAASTLEEAARARGLSVVQSGSFTRVGAVPGLGRLNEAIGAAFGLPPGAVSGPIRAPEGVFVLRVDRRMEADRAAFESQKDAQRAQLVNRMRQQRVEEFLQNLRNSANVVDRRREIDAIARRMDV